MTPKTKFNASIAKSLKPMGFSRANSASISRQKIPSTSGDLKAFLRQKRELETTHFPKIKIKFP